MVYLAFVALQSATVYYYTVGELNAQEPIAEGKIVRVSGKLVDGSFFRENGSTMASFDLQMDRRPYMQHMMAWSQIFSSTITQR